MSKTYVIYSNVIGAPASKFNEFDELKSELLEEGEKEKNKRYKHVYKEVLNDYDFFEYHYITTINAWIY